MDRINRRAFVGTLAAGLAGCTENRYNPDNYENKKERQQETEQTSHNWGEEKGGITVSEPEYVESYKSQDGTRVEPKAGDGWLFVDVSLQTDTLHKDTVKVIKGSATYEGETWLAAQPANRGPHFSENSSGGWIRYSMSSVEQVKVAIDGFIWV